jgi:phage shock protein C
MKRIYRDEINNVIGGVCGGIGTYLDIDPVIVRILFAALILSPFPIILTYILFWIIIPKN